MISWGLCVNLANGRYILCTTSFTLATSVELHVYMSDIGSGIDTIMQDAFGCGPSSWPFSVYIACTLSACGRLPYIYTYDFVFTMGVCM